MNNTQKTDEKESEVTVVDQVPEAISDTEFEEPGQGLVYAKSGELIEHFQSRIKLAEQRIPAIWRLTYPSDWCTFDDETAFFCSWGARRIALPLGVSPLEKPDFNRYDREDSRGKFYILEFEAMFSIVNPKLGFDHRVWAFGSCSSRQSMYAKRFDPDQNKMVLLPIEDIDEQNIKRHAWSSCVRTAISTGYGIQRIPKDAFPDGWWGKIIHPPMARGKEGGQKIDERKLREEIAEMLKEMCDAKPDQMRAQLLKHSYYKTKTGKVYDGVDHPRKIYGWRLEVTYDNIKADYEKYKAEMQEKKKEEEKSEEGKP